MSKIGYNGRAFTVMLNGVPIAAINNKTATMNKEAVDVTNDDSDGFRVLLPSPGVKSMDVSVEGVATSENYEILYAAWFGSDLLDITIVHPNGSTIEAEHGFFFGNLEMGGETAGYVSFTTQLQSSGPLIRVSGST